MSLLGFEISKLLCVDLALSLRGFALPLVLRMHGDVSVSLLDEIVTHAICVGHHLRK